MPKNAPPPVPRPLHAASPPATIAVFHRQLPEELPPGTCW